jgi:putative serine protease PepD
MLQPAGHARGDVNGGLGVYNLGREVMGLPEDKPENSGEEEGPSSPWLPPEDRLWRHPSEVGAHPAAPNRGGSVVSVLGRRPGVTAWALGLLSGCLGALVTAGVLLASGAVPTSSAPLTSLRQAAHVPTPRTSASATITSVLDAVDPSVVGVTVNGPQGEVTSSGVVVSTSGNESYILTDSSQFASGPASQVQVTSDWGEVVPAHLVGVDQTLGIALLRAVLTPVKDVSPATPGSVANVQDGEEVLCVSSLYMAGSDNGPNFTIGYMSDVSSYIQPENGAADGMFSMLVASMNVSSWAYGGAMVDTNGNVLGILVPVPAQSSQAGLAYVAPIDTAMADVSAMMKGGQAPSHPWLGILDATDLLGPGAQQLGLQGGVEVESVAAGSPVARAGVADNDVVTSLDGRPVGSVGAMIAWLAGAKPGEVVRLSWRAGNERRSKDITLGTQPGSANPS